MVFWYSKMVRRPMGMDMPGCCFLMREIKRRELCQNLAMCQDGGIVKDVNQARPCD